MMKCPKCQESIELINKTNPETGMMFNQWECHKHGKVEPMQPLPDLSEFTAPFQEMSKEPPPAVIPIYDDLREAGSGISYELLKDAHDRLIDSYKGDQ